ncbi:hypothetical protein B2J93_2135 [Marssonina coronariae]|uniref:Uncharacterized protein n=1 Tax=Diplocarpon coronariae TaxID=2795749 RepID=A0A218Z0P4_9HELO|nr:hypothetical protein B2J93_2135 [Marssonina coronariae]
MSRAFLVAASTTVLLPTTPPLCNGPPQQSSAEGVCNDAHPSGRRFGAAKASAPATQADRNSTPTTTRIDELSSPLQLPPHVIDWRILDPA